MAPALEPRRTAAAVEHPAGRHVAGRAPARAPALRAAIQAGHPALYGPALDPVRHHRLGPNPRPPWRYLHRDAHAVRPVLPGALVALARLQDPLAVVDRGAQCVLIRTASGYG